jgi:hypothetical protein
MEMRFGLAYSRGNNAISTSVPGGTFGIFRKQAISIMWSP